MPAKSLTYIVFLISFFFLMTFGQKCLAQFTQIEAQELLAQRGINEDTLRNRLIKKGYDPDRIRPEQMERFQEVIIETIEEIENDRLLIDSRVETEEARDSIPPVLTPANPPPSDIPTGVPVNISSGAPIYGQEVFRNNSIAVYQQAEDITASDDYILGTGDKIGVVGFGRSQFEQILEIGPDGFVNPAGLPRILLRGLRFGDAKELLFQRYNLYTVIQRGQFQVTLNKPRNITVNVFGEARTTGAFTLPAFNTAFNVISAAGGPTDIGSVRRIKVISGSEVRPLDVYEFMNDPSVARNFFLQNNDYIHIPVAEKVINIRGAIIRPMAYELLENENLAKLIEYAGGLRPEGYLSDVQITRYLEDRQVVTNVNFRELSANGGDYVLYSGDIVDIKTIPGETINVVNISGAVQFPGDYERREGMRISDLLDQTLLKPEARLDFAYLLVYQPDGTYRYERINLANIINDTSSVENRILGNQDRLQILTLKTYADQSEFSVTGAVRNPNSFKFNPNGQLKIEDAILLAGGLSLDAADHGYIMRFDPREPKTVEYIHVNLREAFDNPQSGENIEIRGGDRIVVYNKGSIRDNFSVAVFGAVRDPGTYPYGPDMTIADLINLAGGFSFSADRARIDIARADFSDGNDFKITHHTTQLAPDFNLNQSVDNSLLLQPFDHIYVRSIPEFELQQTVQIAGEVRYPGMYAILQDKERISDFIKRAGGLTGDAFPEGAKLYRLGDSTGLVVINLDEIIQNENVPSNVALLGGDVLSIPKSRDLVTIGGHVNLNETYSEGFLRGTNSVSVAFRGERSAKYYIDNFAGGISDTGAPSEIKVQYADGGVKMTKKFLFFNNYPRVTRGSIVTVEAKEIKPQVNRDNENAKIDWGTVLKDTLTQATAVLTILILVDQLGN